MKLGRDPGGAGDVEVALEDDGEGERWPGLGFRSGSGSESLSSLWSCRSFCDSWFIVIVALSKLGRTASESRI
jgi:hypothetical protein